MSLMRQIGLLLAAVLLLALAGAVGINLVSTRDALQTQLRIGFGFNEPGALQLALQSRREHVPAAIEPAARIAASCSRTACTKCCPCSQGARSASRNISIGWIAA